MGIGRERGGLFAYRGGRGLLRRMGAEIKLLILLSITALSFSLDIFQGLILLCSLLILSPLSGLSLSTALKALIPALIYALLLYASSLIIAAAGHWHGDEALSALFDRSVFLPRSDQIRSFIRIASILSLSHLIFSTTSALEFKQAVSSIERGIRRLLCRLPLAERFISPRERFAPAFSLFLCFFPLVFGQWRDLDLSWRARGGRGGIKKMLTLIPLLISLSMYRASTTVKAAANREGGEVKTHTR